MKGLPLEVTMECLALREQRTDIDLVADVTEAQLHKVYSQCDYILLHLIFHEGNGENFSIANSAYNIIPSQLCELSRWLSY